MRWLLGLLALGMALGMACGGPPVRWVHHLPEGRVQVVEEGEGFCVEAMVPTPTRRCHRELAIETMVVQPEGVAYVARDDGGWRVFVKGEGGFAPHQRRAWRGVAELRLTPAGEPAYLAEDERGWWVQVGEERSGPWPGVFADSLRVHAGGYAFVADARDGKRVVVDGESSRAWEAVGHLRVVRGRALYLAQAGGRAYVSLGDTVHGPYRRVTEVAEQGRVAGWVAMRDDGWVAVIEGRPSRPYIAVRDLLLEPGGFAYAFVARDDEGEHVVVEGVPRASHRQVGRLAFVGRGLLAYAAREEEAWWVHVGERRWGPVERVDDLEGGGGRWAAVVSAGEGVALWVDGREGARADWISDLAVRRHGVAYLAGRGDRREVVVDDEAYPFPMVLEHSLVLDDDGRHWGCVVLEADGSRPRIVVDGVREHPLRVDDLASATVGRDALEVVATAGALIRAQVREAMAR